MKTYRLGPFALVHEPERTHPGDDFHGPPAVLPAHWILFHGIWMYGGMTLPELFVDVIKNWKSERYIVG